jgi:thiosulfate dehydrogenase [quinone] large subunit
MVTTVNQTERTSPTSGGLPKTGRVRPTTRRVNSVGWVLFPLRAFLGGTFLYAGLQKLADKHFFDAKAPSSVQSQLQAYANSSPVRGLLAAAGHHAVLVGLLIAFGELAVGLGTLLGLGTRLAAAGGAALSLCFLLTVSWHSRPFYYGADIVFLFAWTPLLVAGAGTDGGWSLDGVLRERSRRELGAPPTGRVSVEFAAVRRICGAYDRGGCRLRRLEPCAPEPCPVLTAGTDLAPEAASDLDRRTLLAKAGTAAMLALPTLAFGGVTALVGRLLPSRSPNSSAAGSAGSGGATPPTAAPALTPTTSGVGPGTTAAPAVPAGKVIAAASAIATGDAVSFTDPRTGRLAFVVHTASGGFKGFSGICTHAGCRVEFSPADESFVCPCHGATFDSATGAVTQGPARRPLPPIAIVEGPGGQLYAPS